MQGTGEEQEAQHAVHERFVEVDLAEEGGDGVAQPPGRHDLVDGHQEQRADERHGQRAGRGRQAQDPVIEVAGERGDGEEHRGGVECIHLDRPRRSKSASISVFGPCRGV